MTAAVDRERPRPRVRAGLRPGDLLQPCHPLLVFHSGRLEFGHRGVAGGLALGDQDRSGVVEGRLDDGYDVEHVVRGLLVEEVEGGERERRQRLVSAKFAGVDRARCPYRQRRSGAVSPRCRCRAGPVGAIVARVVSWRARGSWLCPDGGVARRSSRRAREHLHQHRGRRRKWDRNGSSSAVVSASKVFSPRTRSPPAGASDLAQLLQVVAGLGHRSGRSPRRAQVPGRRRNRRCRSRPVRRPAIWWVRAPAGAGPPTVVFAQRGRNSTVPDGHVDADTRRVGAGDDPQQALLGELLYESAVTGEHPGVMDADPGAQQFGQRLAKSGARSGNHRWLLRGASLVALSAILALSRARPLDSSGLGEVDDVNRALPSATGSRSSRGSG